MQEVNIPKLSWVRQIKQTRSQRTQDAILDSTAKLCAKNGVAETCVKEIAELAGCSVGSLYNHFGDKDGLIKAVCIKTIERIFALGEHIHDEFADTELSVREILRRYVAYNMELYVQAPGYKWILTDTARHDVEIAYSWAVTEDRILTLLYDSLIERKAEINHANPAVAVAFAVAKANLLMQARFSETHERSLRFTFSDEVFEQELVAMLIAYLENDSLSQ